MSDNVIVNPEAPTAAKESTQLVPQPVSFVDGFIPLYSFDSSITDPDKAINDIRNLGHQIFYIIATHEEPLVEDDPITKQKKLAGYVPEPRMFKVVQGVVGHSITLVTGKQSPKSLPVVKPRAWFTLPRIPWEVVEKIDGLFRHVYDEIGTEAVVLLTFDRNYLDKPTESERAEGWGVVVPEQSNTAASCNYDPQSVVDDLPDDGSVAIVGSAHSHPGMSAYCSGVDKADQMYFDGLHITFGWRVNSPQTEFHIEMQMSGSAFPFSVNQVFSDVPTAAADAQVKKWATNVAKRTTIAGGGAQTSYYGSYSYSGGGKSSFDSYGGLPKDAPAHPETDVIIIQFADDEKNRTNCPFCYGALSLTVRDEDRQCYKCKSYFIYAGEDILDLVALRREHNLDVAELDLDSNPPTSVWLAKRVKTSSHAYVTDFRELHKGTKARVLAKKVSPPQGKSQNTLKHWHGSEYYHIHDDDDMGHTHDDHEGCPPGVGGTYYKPAGKINTISQGGDNPLPEGGSLTAVDSQTLQALSCDKCLFVNVLTQAHYDDLMFGYAPTPNCRRCDADLPTPAWQSVHSLKVLLFDLGVDQGFGFLDPELEADFDAFRIVNDSMCLACKHERSECVCGSQVCFDVVGDIFTLLEEEPYHLNAPCISCRFYMTSKCQPLVSYMGSWAQVPGYDGSSRIPIDGCAAYQPSTS